MDPDANLKEQLELANAEDRDPEAHERLCDLVLALNDWLSRGGYLPSMWQRNGDLP